MKTLLAALVVLATLGNSSFGCETADLIATLSANGGDLAASGIILEGRPATQCNWATPDGRFRLHYDIIGPYSVFQPDVDTNPPDGIPDYINRAADYLSLSYDTYIQQLGFLAPPSDGLNGGDSLYDVYFTDAIGLTTPEDPSDQYPGQPAYTSFMQLGHDLRYPSRYGEDPLPFLKANVSHEFFHAVEFAYRAYSFDMTPWWFEACANWGEERVFDDLNDVYNNLPAYLQNPYRSLYFTDGEYYYGAWLFPEYLDERFGPALIRECWGRFIDFNFSVMAIDFALQFRYSDFNTEYCRHIVWNYFTGPNYLDGFYTEGASFGTTVFVSKDYTTYPVSWSVNPDPLENVATSYIIFRNPGIPRGDLHIEYSNTSRQQQAVDIVTIGQNGTVGYQTYLVPDGVQSIFDVPGFELADRVIMMPVWPFEGFPKNGITTYAYTADIDSTSTGIAGSQSEPVKYELNGAYPNPFNSAVVISFSSPTNVDFRFTIYDIGGRQIYSDYGRSQTGTNIIHWQAKPDIASGILYYVIDLNEHKFAGKMSFVK